MKEKIKNFFKLFKEYFFYTQKDIEDIKKEVEEKERRFFSSKDLWDEEK